MKIKDTYEHITDGTQYTVVDLTDNLIALESSRGRQIIWYTKEVWDRTVNRQDTMFKKVK